LDVVYVTDHEGVSRGLVSVAVEASRVENEGDEEE
jgi:hypothetical protein